MKPFSQSSEENKEPILEVLREAFATRQRVLEIGSGTGQHAVFFARQLPHLFWQPANWRRIFPASTRGWPRRDCRMSAAPLLLDIERQPWPDSAADAVFSANTVHIISWSQVESLFAASVRCCRRAGYSHCTVRSITEVYSPATAMRVSINGSRRAIL